MTKSQPRENCLDEATLGCSPIEENTIEENKDETYAKASLGCPLSEGVEENKILGVLWNPTADCLIFDVSELAQLATSLQPTKRNVVSLIGTTHWDFWHLLLSSSRSCSRNYAKTNLTGTVPYQKNLCKNGTTWWPISVREVRSRYLEAISTMLMVLPSP